MFSFLSRRFEHQADWFAAQHMARSLARDPVAPAAAPLVAVPVLNAGGMQVSGEPAADETLKPPLPPRPIPPPPSATPAPPRP